MSDLSRRAILKSGALGAVSWLGFDALFGYSQVSAQTAGDDAQTILNLAATAETFATTHYYTVLTQSDIALTPNEIEILKGFLDAELQHLEYLNENGAATLSTDWYFPADIYNDREQFGDITELIETTFISAYLAATRRLSELGASLLAATAAQVAAIEQEHLSIVRGIGGRRPNNVAFARALFFNVSDAVPALQPFLEGGTNYQGPVAFPGAEAIRTLIGDVGVLPIATFASQQYVDQPAASTTCTVTSKGTYNCNLRSGPGVSYPVLGTLTPQAVLEVNGQRVDNDGFTWYRSITGSQWVRADIVEAVGACGVLPTV